MVKRKNDNIVLNYFNSIGLKTIKSPDKFWSNIKLFHGKEIHDKLIQILESRGELLEQDHVTNNESEKIENIYEVKNQDLKLSIDFSNLTADFIRNFLEWFVQYKPNIQPQKILEIGCDNGITSCFLALQFPDAEVVGIDISQNGIRCAKELAEKLGLNNTKFISIDIKSFFQENQEHDFDMVISLRTIHELIGYPPKSQHFSTKEYIEQLELKENPIFKSIKKLLKDEKSVYISCERLPYDASYAYWAELLKLSHLYIDWNVSAFNRSIELNETQTMPILVASGINNHVSTWEGLVRFTSEDYNVDLSSFTKITGMLAEDFMTKIPNKELIGGTQVNWKNGSGNFRLELWKDSSSIYLYKYNNVGYRELEKYTISDESNAAEEIEMFLEMYASPAYTETFTYQTIEEREKQNKQFV